MELKLPGSLGFVFVYDEGVAVIAIEPVPGGKPHEAPAVLQNGNDIALREAVVGGEVGEFEVPHLIGRLRHGEDGAHGEAIPRCPRGVHVLADVE